MERETAHTKEQKNDVLPARSPKINLTPARGERCLVCGQTGSGKTVALTAIAAALNEGGDRVVVLDAKVERRYSRLPHSSTVHRVEELWGKESRAEKKSGPAILIWRPDPVMGQDPAYLDAVLYELYRRFHGSIVIDELYPFHTSGRAGPGMTALLTRGRSKGLTTIMGSQRPTWISRFCLSEAQHYWVYALVDRLDRQRMSGVIPNFPHEQAPPRYWFYYYSHLADMDRPVLFRPLKLDRGKDEELLDEPIDNEIRWI